jgi:hypothetical protein
VPVLQVVEVRYQAGGQFGSGFKGRPKSDAGIRELPLAPLVSEPDRSDAICLALEVAGEAGGPGVPPLRRLWDVLCDREGVIGRVG